MIYILRRPAGSRARLIHLFEFNPDTERALGERNLNSRPG